MEAKLTLDRAAKLAPDAPWAYLELAQLPDQAALEATAYLQRAARVAPTEPWVDVRWAQLCVGWGDLSCAEEQYARAIKLRPDWGWLRSQVGDFYREPKNPAFDPTKAATHYHRAVELRGCDPWAHQRLAYILAAGPQRDYEAAARHYQLAVQLLHPATPSEVVAGIEGVLQDVLAKSETISDLAGEVPAFCQP